MKQGQKMQEWINWCESAEDGEVSWVLCSVPSVLWEDGGLYHT